MNRREFLAAASSVGTLAAQPANKVKLGIDIFSLRSQNWTPIQYLDYCAERKVQVVHFSEVRFLGSLDPTNLRAVKAHAEERGLEVEIGMKSICPSSKMFEPGQGTAEVQLGRMIDAAVIVGSKIVRCVLGSADDRKTASIEKHIENTALVLRNIRSKAKDNNVRIAIENHAGDMQARELKMLIEEAGPDFVGVCLDSGNPLWALESPHVTLETLHPYVLTSHTRDSAVWLTPEGASVTWVETGRGNVDIAGYLKRFVELCPNAPVSLESIVFGPRKLNFKQPEFWDGYHGVRAFEFERFLALAEQGKPYRDEPWETPNEAQRQRAALDASLAATKQILGIPV